MSLETVTQSSLGDQAGQNVPVPHESEHHVQMLGQALGECIAAAGIIRPDASLSGPELLMFADDLKRHLAQQTAPQGTTSDKYRAELYDEVWEKARSMGYSNVTDALVELERMKTAAPPEQSGIMKALSAFVELAEDRLRELGALSPEMAKCLAEGRAAVAAQGGE